MHSRYDVKILKSDINEWIEGKQIFVVFDTLMV